MYKPDTDTIGVIVARFQVPMLHEGHQYTINEALKNHHTVVIILGTSYSLTTRNPLSFEMRKEMIHSVYAPMRVRVIESVALPSSYEERSQRIDELLEKEFPGKKAVMYGARDSFIHTYKGKHEVCETETVFDGSATLVRESIQPYNSIDFREGVVYALMNQKPISHPTVDVAITKRSMDLVLLVGKNEEEGKLRLPGVFFRPNLDDSYEEAAIRCIKKEVPGVTTKPPVILKSCTIDDWRFKKTEERIITLVMEATYLEGDPYVGDGIDTLEWVNLCEASNRVVDSHRQQIQILKEASHLL